MIYYDIIVTIFKMIQLLKRLQRLLLDTCSKHKKKIIFVVILTLGYQIAKRKIKTEHLISFVMFFVKFSSKVVEMLPLPVDPELRHKQQFRFIQQKPVEQLRKLINTKQILLKVKNKQQDISSLKKAVLSFAILNILLYKMTTIYELFQRKYKADFEDIGAADAFFQTVLQMKEQYIENLPNFRHFVLSQISNQIDQLDLSAQYGYGDCQEFFTKMFQKLFSQQLNINQKIFGKKTYAASSKQYKIAANYFRSNKQYVQQKQSHLVKGLKLLSKPISAFFKLGFWALGSIFKDPEIQLTKERFSLNQMLYVLPLKKFQSKQRWPNPESKYLYQMVQEQIINFLYSINFNIVSYRRAELNLQIFLNRLKIYFVNRASNQKKKLLNLIPIFYKIIEQQLIPSHQNKKAYYEKQIFSALRDTQVRLDGLILSQMKLRSKALQEFYIRNQVQHLQKDMQIKIYNERQGMVIESTRKTQKEFQGKDDILELMNITQNADKQNENTQEGVKMLRELAS